MGQTVYFMTSHHINPNVTTAGQRLPQKINSTTTCKHGLVVNFIISSFLMANLPMLRLPVYGRDRRTYFYVHVTAKNSTTLFHPVVILKGH